MWFEGDMLEKAHAYAERWYDGYELGENTLLTHLTYVVNVFHQYWPLAPEQRVAGVLLSYAPQCSGPTTGLANKLVSEFGEHTAQMVWEMDRTLSMLHMSSLYTIETHVRKLVRQDIWTLRAVASYVVVSSKTLHHRRAIRAALIRAGDRDTKQLLTAHT